jgi:hypothetical protein
MRGHICLAGSLLTSPFHHGSAKAVMFVSEFERDRSEAAERAGLTLKGRFRDFYGLEEQCVMFRRTAEDS